METTARPTVERVVALNLAVPESQILALWAGGREMSRKDV